MKAFDTVPDQRLTNVLQYYGFQNPLLSWIKAFLCNRRQRVVVNGTTSSWFDVKSGIPQGSVLGPVLFVIYINTMVERVKDSEVYLYADDMKIFREVNSVEDCHKLQGDLDNLFDWTKESLLKFHPDKCISMRLGSGKRKTYLPAHTYNMNNVPLTHSHAEKDLGVIIDSELNFDSHITSKINKANSVAGLIRRTMQFLDADSFRLLFTALVRPHLEYANSVWNPHLKKHITAIENVQRRATKFVPGLSKLPYKERLQKVKLPTLSYRRYRGDMIEVFKITHGLYDESVSTELLVKQHSITRGHPYSLYKRHCRLDLRKYSFCNRVVDQWNVLPEHVVNVDTVMSFERALDKLWMGTDVMYCPETNLFERQLEK